MAQTQTTLGQLCAALWDSQSRPNVIEPGFKPVTVVTPLALGVTNNYEWWMESGAESRGLSFIKCITPVQPKMITPTHRAYIGCQSKTDQRIKIRKQITPSNTE
jgi:hypothetical protein